jgi:hypothetical protein
MRENIHCSWIRGKKEGHQVLSPNRRKRGGTETCTVGYEIRNIKCDILDQARELRNTEYKDIGIGPDQTKKQKQAEARLAAVADKKNREDLTEQDRAKKQSVNLITSTQQQKIWATY